MDPSNLSNSDIPILMKGCKSYAEFLCGYGAAFINITVTFPINKVTFRQQLYGVSSVTAYKQIYHEGLRHLYRGLLPPLLQKSTSVAAMFGIYQNYNELLLRKTNLPTDVRKGTAAFFAGTTEAILTPFERIQTLMQDQTYHKRFQNTFEAFRMTSSYGLREYYRGLTAILLRNGPSNVCFFLGRDHIKECLPEAESKLEVIGQDFISGALLGAVISTVLFPLNAIKTRMQSEFGCKFISIYDAYCILLTERNYSRINLLRGMHINYIRSFMSWGIINASYEFLLTFLKPKS
ncbi:mitochondrial nicotinamide adenine dinucleotide transporter SLC25A51 [Octopus bimaculoides]|uniref:Solute carrier family 25 member 51 n=1 Tax=Octopus bimaculoides TaxID=37653 RepID=A0A0L8GR83_OCTBM|nr:mitochondrial nicotinamide adenine dinucleotide transporter SLC25A51 [Octopus bimaculoides]XP_014778720.1 mitochondrial nicotinamide adenine dinucleotide transporter SLC25A51 [Octopus bimaculoides]XP_014778721.1 mitochondrial nicotinamide adenine dinucleotide transporter SLC25A51 [Octopus bimaculoides]XP_014778722.1 mitochondrial nicotinamide adenine dinucleotide transporter SLC25A51 [Octopus bimaculoides]XP_052822875.1 mitochondrial nicotinamide adenine dinucleotide transporter SLC25A51 [Oc|eukprot:XP_014778719.1 PREDICTED: solute carrier family 25 member 51-like [Octopus bimaculoides]